ncbi:Calcium-dependent protein kinase 2 (PfCDPK2) [Durusdinium trenchii]|uniref:Calcium-dependent protein kinase 2 (PfCDPK2) n=1 Tax=Durusdinium trenchii TaxID=1381693 RepID=A0ABP0Q735_9DINO
MRRFRQFPLRCLQLPAGMRDSMCGYGGERKYGLVAALELVEQHRVIGCRTYSNRCATMDHATMFKTRVVRRDAGTMQIEDEDEVWFEELYTLDKKVGEGSFGNVYKAIESVDNAVLLAVQVFSLASPIASPQAKVDSEEAKRKLASFISECAMLSRLDHPYVVRMHESFQSAGSLHLVLEMCQGGELYNLLVRKIKEEDGLEEVTGQIFFRQMLHAVGYLHAGRIVHRDVKPENFLVSGDTDRPEELVLKLCDFGTATVLTQQKPRSMVNIGTLSYTAPEVYMRKGADLPADIWSLGVVLYVMLTGTNPFRNGKETSKQETVKRIKSGVFATQRAGWLKVSEPGQDMVKKLLVLIEDKRLTCCEVGAGD